MANEVCFRTLHLDEPWTLESYLSVGGYESLKKILTEKIPAEDIIEEVKTSAFEMEFHAPSGKGSKVHCL